MGWLARFSIMQRLGLGFGLLLVLLVGAGFAAKRGMDSMQERVTELYQDNVESLQVLGDISALTLRNRVLVMDMILNPAPDNLARRIAEQSANSEKLDKFLEQYAGHATGSGPTESNQADLYHRLQASLTAYRQEGLYAARDAVKAGDTARAMQIYQTKVSPLAPPAFDAINALMEGEKVHARQLYESALQHDDLLQRGIWVFIAVALVVGGGGIVGH